MDQGVANDEWMTYFSNYSLVHLPHSFSDHCPLLVNTDKGCVNCHFTHFKFEAAWIIEESCKSKVWRLWNLTSGLVSHRLRMVSVRLDRWFESLRRTKALTNNELRNKLQQLNNSYPTDEVLKDTINVKLALNMEADKEEVYWEQPMRRIC